MAIMNEAKNGADLTHPRASLAWVVGAVFAGLLLGAVAVIVLKIGDFAKAKIPALPLATSAVASTQNSDVNPSTAGSVTAWNF